MLVRAAHSANIKERRDCSTALFDARGELVMQAEHIPVHLGSMPDAVAAVLGEQHRPGDVWILNDPYRGGTHLPDITLISPIFTDDELLGFAASRAHHADVGGPTPAGMPVDSTRARGRGGGDPAHPGRRRAAGAPGRRDAQPAAAPRRPARAAGRQPDRRASPARAGRQARARGASLRDGGDPRLRRAPHARRAGRAARRRLRGRGPDGGRRRRPAARHPAAGHRDDRRRAPDARLHRHRSPGRGQPQLPPAGHQVRRLLRRPRAHRPRRAALGRRLPAGGGDRSGGVPAAMRGRLPRWPPATSRPPAGWPTW